MISSSLRNPPHRHRHRHRHRNTRTRPRGLQAPELSSFPGCPNRWHGRGCMCRAPVCLHQCRTFTLEPWTQHNHPNCFVWLLFVDSTWREELPALKPPPWPLVPPSPMSPQPAAAGARPGERAGVALRRPHACVFGDHPPC